MFILPDFPATTRSLTPLERKLALLRMSEDVGEEDEENNSETQTRWNDFTRTVTDWKVWWFAFAMLSQVVSGSFGAYFPSELSL